MTKARTYRNPINGRAFRFTSNYLGDGHIVSVLVIEEEDGVVPWPAAPETTGLTEEAGEALVERHAQGQRPHDDCEHREATCPWNRLQPRVNAFALVVPE